jgi:sec-independent protein translocase protein TatA
VVSGMLANIIGPDGIIILVVLLILLLFGGARLPRLARALGESHREFRKGLEQGAQDEEPEAKKGSGKEELGSGS